MNTTMEEIITSNNTKINYFNLLVRKNKIPISCDIVLDKINPYFSKKISIGQFLNNILFIVITKKLLRNFSLNVRDNKYNIKLNNFKNLLKYNKELFHTTILEIFEEALKNTELKIPSGYDFYSINTYVNSNYCYDIITKIHTCGWDSHCYAVTEYMTPVKYKKYVLNEFKKKYITEGGRFDGYEDPITNEEFYIKCFEEAFNHNYHYDNTKQKPRLPTVITFAVNYKKHREFEKKNT